MSDATYCPSSWWTSPHAALVICGSKEKYPPAPCQAAAVETPVSRGGAECLISLTCIITSVWGHLLWPAGFYLALSSLPQASLSSLYSTSQSGAAEELENCQTADYSWMKENTERRFGIIGLIRPTGITDWMICLSDDTNAQVWVSQWSIYAPESYNFIWMSAVQVHRAFQPSTWGGHRKILLFFLQN